MTKRCTVLLCSCRLSDISPKARSGPCAESMSRIDNARSMTWTWYGDLGATCVLECGTASHYMRNESAVNKKLMIGFVSGHELLSCPETQEKVGLKAPWLTLAAQRRFPSSRGRFRGGRGVSITLSCPLPEAMRGE